MCPHLPLPCLSSQEEFVDKTPYTIMFGPDKCGEDYKLHFIFRHKNLKTGEFEEKHAKKPDSDLRTYYTDKKTHLYTLGNITHLILLPKAPPTVTCLFSLSAVLPVNQIWKLDRIFVVSCVSMCFPTVLNPDNSFEILIDQTVVNSGSLLNDMTPPINPPAEIEDPDDQKPEDWDERPKIQDPDAVKPEDWWGGGSLMPCPNTNTCGLCTWPLYCLYDVFPVFGRSEDEDRKCV